MIYGENFNLIFDAISRIENHIGLNSSNDDISVNGRLNQIMSSSVFRGSGAIEPFCEVDIPIHGDGFTVTNEPMLIGESWIVQNTAIITKSEDTGTKNIEEWFDVEFDGNNGTLVGANGRYDGNYVTVTYFHDNLNVYYGIDFKNGLPEVSRTKEDILLLVVKDIVSGINYRIVVDSKGRISNIPTVDIEIGDSVFVDLITDESIEIYIENGYMNWRVV